MQSKPKRVLYTLLGTAAVFVLLSLVLFIIVYIQGADVPVINTKGMIAHDERDLLRDSTLLMLIVVVPVFILTYTFFWRYREGNDKAKYSPDLERNPIAESIWWGIPCLIILTLAILTWVRTHQLDPFKPIDSNVKPVTIQVVALDWKWLFIYPEEKIATINFFQFPEKTPLNFQITADAPMNSFWIPSLGGQMYAMPGMASKLHLIADNPGIFRGSSANLSGKGFAGMVFDAKATTQDEFKAWVEQVRQSGKNLEKESYLDLAKPSEYDPVSYYVLDEDKLFDWIVMKYMMPQTKE